MIAAVSASSTWLAVAMMLLAMSFLISSAAFTPIRWDMSETVIPSWILMTFFSSAISVIWVFAPFLVGFFFLPRSGIVTRPQTRSAISCLEKVLSFSEVLFLPRSALFLVTSTSSRPRPKWSGTTLNSRTSPIAFLPGATGIFLYAVVVGVTRRTWTSGRLITTACVAVGRSVLGSWVGWGGGAAGRGGTAGRASAHAPI